MNVESEASLSVTSNSREVILDGGINFRDIGGYKSRDGRLVRWRKVLRSGHLSNLTDNDKITLLNIGVNQVHDFRRKEEQNRQPSREFGAKTINDYYISIGSMSKFWDILLEGGLSSSSSHNLVVNGYKSCIDEVAPAYRRFMHLIIRNAEGVSLIHCAAGKDRTGLATALILAALDVPDETIIDDYLLTKTYFDTDNLINIVEGHLRNSEVPFWKREWLEPYCSVHRDNIETFLLALKQNYGSLENYLDKALHFGESHRRALRKAFLE
ncbi:MAG: hypothetical protein CMK30_00750 [Porticoccaceae bacterium]|nr:hypothetical protein [Porticoccaceae bacterium]|tara:strand:- start:13159 stop:13965 length:807 start_codon:yes stop_codon:yes gene_type:complete